MAKKILSMIFICVVLSVFTGCSKEKDTVSRPSKETEAETERPRPTEPPILYELNPLFADKAITKIVISKEPGEEEIIVEIASERKIKEILSMFSNWKMETKKVPEEYVKDLDLDIEVIFSENLVIYTSLSCGPELDYYGCIKDKGYYYLPRRFWEYVYSKMS